MLYYYSEKEVKRFQEDMSFSAMLRETFIITERI